MRKKTPKTFAKHLIKDSSELKSVIAFYITKSDKIKSYCEGKAEEVLKILLHLSAVVLVKTDPQLVEITKNYETFMKKLADRIAVILADIEKISASENVH